MMLVLQFSRHAPVVNHHQVLQLFQNELVVTVVLQFSRNVVVVIVVLEFSLSLRMCWL